MRKVIAVIRRVFSKALPLLFLLTPGAVLAESWPSGREVVELRARPFALQDVRLLPGPFHEAMQRTRRYLHELESDRLLHFFHKTAGLEPAAEPMGGWETTEVRGHTMGHYLSACALMYASTGDQALKTKADAIVTELAKCQAQLGNGYLSAFPESFIDRCLARKPVWAPLYTLHKLLAGLIDMHLHCNNEQALTVALGMARWLDTRVGAIGHEEMQQILNRTEQGGMDEALANLSGLTGEKRWLELSRQFVQDRYVQPLVRQQDQLKGEHVNSFVPNIIGTARQYELDGDIADRDLVGFFWNQVVDYRCYCTGGTSNHEHWRTEPNQLASELGGQTQETCCTYNMLKLTRHLFCWDPQARYADYYERSLINSILATQDPKSGMMMYFVPLGGGFWKYFNTPRDSFWCCTGTGLENHSKYGDSIYFHDGTGLWVNLFIASEVRWKEKGLRLCQETGFPDQQGTALIVHAAKPVKFALRVRIPSWAGQGVRAQLNGQPLDVAAKPNSYLVLERTWSEGDRVDLVLPMSLGACPMPDDPTLLAIMYGPLVLAGKLGGEDLTDAMLFSKSNNYNGDVFRGKGLATVPDIVTENSDLSHWVRPVPGQPLTFQTVGVGRPDDVTLVPYHRLWGERYAVYWRVVNERQWQCRQAEQKARAAAEAARRQAIAARLVDRVETGNADSEKAHQLRAHKSGSGPFNHRIFRDARIGGWFEYELSVRPDRPMCLLCTYWGSDKGRVFDILIDGSRIATQTLAHNRPNEFFDIEYAIPPTVTKGKERVTVKFAGRPGRMAGGLFGLAMLSATP